MREIINIITEGDVKRVAVWSGATIPVLHNPSKEQFLSFQAKHRSIRGLINDAGDDIWLWDASMAVHSNLIQELALGSYDCISISDGRWSGPVLDGHADAYRPAIQRLTPYIPKRSKTTDAELLAIYRELVDL